MCRRSHVSAAIQNGKRTLRTAPSNASMTTEPVTGTPKLVQALQLPDACLKVFREWVGNIGGAGANKDLPVIQLAAGRLAAIATVAEQVLQQAGLPIYQRGDSLVRPIIEEVDASHERRTKVAQLKTIDQVYLRDLMSRVANWLRFDKREKQLVPADPPPDIAATVLARQGEWGFPKIAGVIMTPTMRPDGTLLTEPGYRCRQRGCSLLSRRQCHRSRRPDAGRCAGIAGAAGRPADRISVGRRNSEGGRVVGPDHPGGARRFCGRADARHAGTVAGSGKSYLIDIVAAIVIGQPMPVMAAGRSEEETEKRLGAALIAGQPLISIDNVNGELGGDALCQIIERPLVDVRVLGKSERVRNPRPAAPPCSAPAITSCWSATSAGAQSLPRSIRKSNGPGCGSSKAIRWQRCWPIAAPISPRP